jgi:transposase
MENYYPRAARERAMKIQEIIIRAIEGRITWVQAANIIGVSGRQMRRMKRRYEVHGWDGLYDRRRGLPSPKRVPIETVREVLRLYREEYYDFNVRHFHEKLEEEHGIKLSYTWVKLALQAAELVKKDRKRGVHRKRRPRRPVPGMMLHIDASRHRWLPDGSSHDFIVVMDDATSEIYYAQLVDEESTSTVMAALREVIEKKGLFCSLYSDRASHFYHTPKAGDVVDRQQLTQVGRAMAELGIEMIAAYSPQARGRSERGYRTWQGRLPQELRKLGAKTVDDANQFLRDSYIEKFNNVFSVAASEKGDAFLSVGNRDLELIFCLQHERVVGKDNTVRLANRCLQIEPTKWWSTLAGCRVRVLEHLDGKLTIRYGNRVVGTYSGDGVPLEEPRSPKKAVEKWKSQKGTGASISRDSHFPTATTTTRS